MPSGIKYRCLLNRWGAAEAACSVGTLFHVAMIMGAQLCLWDDFEEILIYKTMFHISIFLVSAPNIFHGWNGNIQLSRSGDIHDTIRLLQINDLVMFGYACPSHFRPGLYVMLMFPVTHLKHDFRIRNVCHCTVSQSETKHGRLSILVYIERGSSYVISWRK